MQLSVVATCATECGGLSRDSQFRKKSNDVFCCTARLFCEQGAQWAIGATRCDDKCANTVLLETLKGPAEVYASAVVTQ